MSTFHLTIRTPDAELFTGDVSSFNVATETGYIQVLAHHANFTGTVQFSPVKVENEKGAETYLVRNGIFYFDHKKNAASLLALYCEEQSQVSYQTTEEYLKFLTEELAKGDLSEFQVKFLHGERLAVEKQMKTKA